MPLVRRTGTSVGIPGTAGHPDHFRTDIEGLRGLAILMVVAFHAGPAMLGGGFIGVDVFFVISGFLITGLLVRELGRTGRVDLAYFYVRRVRRLLPAAALALGVTLLLSAWLIPPLDLPRTAGDGISAALSVSNIRFALAGGDYFSAVESPSPFLHYWSLSVEEQFYLVWPALLLVAFRIGRSLRSVAIVIAAVALMSLALAVVLTDVAANWAFYSLPTRAWQLALGGLLAVIAIERRGGRWLSGALAVVGWLGLGAVLLGGIRFDSESAYPGYWALLPTLGAVALIAGGDRRGGPGLLLRTAPFRFTGRISYALYLWHWPLLVLPAIALGRDLTPLARVSLVCLAVVIATASTLLVEEPIRRGSGRLSGRRQLAVVGTLGMALLVSVTVGLGAVTWVTEAAIAETREGTLVSQRPMDSESDEGPADATVEMGGDLEATELQPLSDDLATAPPVKVAAGRPPRTQVPDRSAPGAIPVASTRAESDPPPTPRPTKKPRPPRRDPPIIRLPAGVKPSVWEARDDEEQLRRNGCLEGENATEPKRCEFGKTTSKFVVALVGDSHASHWFPALLRVADDHGWRLVTFVKVSCPFAGYTVSNRELKRAYRECDRFNENTVAALRRIRPDLVITALSRWQHPTSSADESVGAQGAAIARMLDRVPGRKVIIADVPYPDRNVPACLSANVKDIRPCAVAAANRTSGGSPLRERIAAKRSKGAFIDFGDVICGGPRSCPVVNHDKIVFRDNHHLTATFSRWLSPALDRALSKVMRGRS